MTSPAPGRTGGDLLVDLLRRHDVDTVFGIVSVHNLPLVEAVDRDLRFVPVRHAKQCGKFAATARYPNAHGNQSSALNAANLLGAEPGNLEQQYRFALPFGKLLQSTIHHRDICGHIGRGAAVAKRCQFLLGGRFLPARFAPPAIAHPRGNGKQETQEGAVVAKRVQPFVRNQDRFAHDVLRAFGIACHGHHEPMQAGLRGLEQRNESFLFGTLGFGHGRIGCITKVHVEYVLSTA